VDGIVHVLRRRCRLRRVKIGLPEAARLLRRALSRCTLALAFAGVGGDMLG
jgi:hypothetical protein